MAGSTAEIDDENFGDENRSTSALCRKNLQSPLVLEPAGAAVGELDRFSTRQMGQQFSVRATVHIVYPLEVQNVLTTGPEEPVPLPSSSEPMARS